MAETGNNMISRAFSLPVQACDPKEGWETIRECWRHATTFANWCVHVLATRDVIRLPGMESLPKMTPCDLYALAFGRKKEKRGREDPGKVLPAVSASYAGGEFFGGAMTSASSIIHDVQSKYIRDRLAVIWLRKQALTTYRYPHPWPVYAQAWHKAWLDSDQRPHVEVALPGGRVVLRLRGGPEFARQMGQFRQIVQEDLPRKQLLICEHLVIGDSHRPAVKDRRVMLKMVAAFPPRENAGHRTLNLFTTPEAFWVAELDGRQAWVLNSDHVRRVMDWKAIHTARLERLRQDAKAEVRMTGRRERAWQRSLGRVCLKMDRRMDSWLHESAAHLVSFAVRQRVGEVIYDDSCRDFIPSFPWYTLSQRLADKLAVESIRLHELPDVTKGE